MGNQVYVNSREIACKAADGKSVCSFPDVCLSPPSPPAGPIPIPYPNTGMAFDCTEGSKTVKISGQEVMLKDKSYFKKSTGDEAATKSLGMGVVTHQIQGKVYFTSWSMDVKFEGENVVRHLDMTTHNHMSYPGNTAPWPYLDTGDLAPGGVCANDPDPECKLVPYDPGCTDGKTPHHAIPVHCFMGKGARSLPKAERKAASFDGCKEYDMNKAPCICVDGKSKTGTHGKIHSVFDDLEDNHLTSRSPRVAGSWSYQQAKEAAVQSTSTVDLGNGKQCSPGCMEKQVSNYHEQDSIGIKSDTALRADSSGRGTPSGFTPSIVESGVGT